MNFLKTIIRHKIKEISQKKKMIPVGSLINRRISELRDFKGSIKKKEISLIAEIKKRSPSAGLITNNFNPEKIARIYESAGADAISVLTDEKYFGGKGRHISQVKNVCKLPVLRKDFIIDEYQIFESYYLGVDAVLLIAQLLTQEKLKKFIKTARTLGLASMVEIHNEADLRKTLKSDAEIIGVNNRNLKNFEVDINISLRLRQLIPDYSITVSESGIKNYADLKKLKDVGFDAVLVGTSLLQTRNIAKKIKELKNIKGVG